MTIVTIGIDLAKNVFAVHGVNELGKAELVRPAVKRGDLETLIAGLPPCLIGMEACSGAHEWARRLDARVAEYDKHLSTCARQNHDARRLMQLPGIGPVTASALVASVGDGRDFANGRQLAAWLAKKKDDAVSRWARETESRRGYWRAVVALAAKNARLAWAVLRHKDEFKLYGAASEAVPVAG